MTVFVSVSSRLRASLFTLVTLACVTLSATGALAQDVQYRSVTKIDMGTGFNIALKLAGVSETSQMSYIKGSKMRSESDKSATIFDMERARFIIINDANKTYIIAPLADMMAAFGQMAASTNARTDNGLLKGTARDSAGNKLDYTVNVSLEPTSEHDNVNGQDARRTFATIQTDLQVTPEGDTKSTEAGTLVMLIDTWNANGGPAYTAIHNFQQSMSKDMREQAFANMKGASAALAANPQMADAMKKAAAEQQKMDGIAMRSTTYMVIVPPSLKFDRDAAIKPQDSGGASGATKRALGGMLSGALRGKTNSDNNSAPAQPKQVTMMKMTTEIRDVQTASLPASLFEPPAGYKEVPFTPPTIRK